MKVGIYEDEWFPVYSLSKESGFGRAVELSEDDCAAYQSAAAAFLEWQDRLMALYDEAAVATEVLK